jgi:PhnO protein
MLCLIFGIYVFRTLSISTIQISFACGKSDFFGPKDPKNIQIKKAIVNMQSNTRQEIRLRAAGKGDLSIVADLLSHLGYTPKRPCLSQAFDQALTDESLHILLAADNVQCLGLITLRTQVCLRLAGTLASIEELVVHPRARGLGIGCCMLEWAKATAKDMQAVRLEVAISTSRQSYERQFYLKNGFSLARSRLYRWPG